MLTNRHFIRNIFKPVYTYKCQTSFHFEKGAFIFKKRIILQTNNLGKNKLF